MCCIISGEPTTDPKGRLRTFETGRKFQVDMLNAPCVDCPYSCCWFMGQFLTVTGGCTQYALRSKALEGDMQKYTCCQGYFNNGCFTSGTCGESSCPELCLFIESCCCNCFAVSATRIYVMEKYDLSSDPCDYRLIRINNCLQLLSCICDIAAIFAPGLRHIAAIIDRIADIFYHCIAGCMTAQVAHEINHQLNGMKSNLLQGQFADPYTGPSSNK